MTSFLLDLAKGSDEPRTVIVVDESGVEHPRQYQLRPRRLLYAVGAAAAGLAVLLFLLVLLTPLRVLLFGPDPETLRETVRLNSIRAAALEDSLALQDEYLARLRSAIVGEPETATEAAERQDTAAARPDTRPMEVPALPRSDDWADHEQPALALGRLAADRRAPLSGRAVEAFFARGFDAARGHFGIDEAVEEGTPVRSIGDGYVVFADWTNDGGYIVAVQHADGYLAVYKHNSRLLKRIGDRVRSREAVALSGNTGEITTGPHLHFELWRNGLAQDPRLYLIGP